MKLRTGVLLITLIVFSFSYVQGQQAREVFGKNRIQYRQFDWVYLSGENFDVYYYDGRKTVATQALEFLESEFDRITERGGVLGAMERMYQRNKIQEESLYYEHMKHTGELPLIGVNTFLNKKGSPTVLPNEVIRSTEEEREQQIQNLHAFWKRNESKNEEALKRLKEVAVSNGNLFAELMETVKYCSLGQITHALYEVGGQYRRNM